MHLRPSPALVALTLGTGACYHVMDGDRQLYCIDFEREQLV